MRTDLEGRVGERTFVETSDRSGHAHDNSTYSFHTSLRCLPGAVDLNAVRPAGVLLMQRPEWMG